MNIERAVYIIGLIVVSIYLFFGFDDLIWDILTARHRIGTGGKRKLHFADVDSKAPRLLAVVIAAWHEDAVIEPVIKNIIKSVQYPLSMYHVFLGVYPNDPDTIAAAKRLEDQFDNVHMIVNVTPGPTCKADNINNVLRQISAFEQAHGWEFASVTVHDSEDVVHPYELKVTNYLIDRFDALQFPVFPLQERPTLKNLFKNMTAGTYADEFAENHYRTMVLRDESSAIVPSAGTGFVLTRRVLQHFGGQDVFPQDSLTEDYKLSLTLHQMGFKVHYVLEKVKRLQDDGSTRWDYISTRSMFPMSFSTAVRQKTRWIYGITMQSFRLRDMFTRNKIGFAGRYTLYKDLKAKFGNLLVLPGYLVFIYFMLSMLLPLPVMYPVFTLSWWMCMVLTAMMIERQILRAIAIRQVYGFRSMFVACFFPPIMPIRLVWGNIINMTATLRAWKQLLVGNKKSPDSKKKPKWSKTDHEFLEQNILKRYYRNLGDVLLEREYLDADTLHSTLQEAKAAGRRLGDLLLEKRLISEEQLLRALASVHSTVYVPDLRRYVSSPLTIKEGRDSLRAAGAFPLLSRKDGIVMAISGDTPQKALADFEKQLGEVQIVYAKKADILTAIESCYERRNSKPEDALRSVYEQVLISPEQELLAGAYMQQQGESAEKALDYMGLGNTITLCEQARQIG